MAKSDQPVPAEVLSQYEITLRPDRLKAGDFELGREVIKGVRYEGGMLIIDAMPGAEPIYCGLTSRTDARLVLRAIQQWVRSRRHPCKSS